MTLRLRFVIPTLTLLLALGCGDSTTVTPDATTPSEDAAPMDASSEDSAPPADSEPDGALADATADASVDASPPDAMMDASFPINLVCERICSFLATCSPMEGGMGEVAECQRGCEMDLVDCSAEQLSALHACGDLMCTSRDDFEAVVRCVTAVECVDMEMMDRPAA